MRSDVVVVGAGPVGLATALELVRLSKTVRIFSAESAPTTESRATGVLPRTLEWLEPTGATERLIAAGVRMKGVRVVSGGRSRAVIDPTRLKHRFNFMLSLPQSRTETILTECLAERGVAVERGREVTEVVPGTRGAEAVVLSDARSERVAADWLVGADGAHSMVRKTLGIGFPGAAYPFEWKLADVDLGDAEEDRGELVLEPHAPIVLRFPIGEGRHRILANGPDVIGRAPSRWKIGAVLWQSSYRVSHRQADRLGAGRVWLVGDAAHIHSPAGGRGMNLGVEDGVTLARRIAAGDLGHWSSERHAKAAATIRESDAMQRVATANVASLTPICRQTSAGAAPPSTWRST